MVVDTCLYCNKAVRERMLIMGAALKAHRFLKGYRIVHRRCWRQYYYLGLSQ